MVQEKLPNYVVPDLTDFKVCRFFHKFILLVFGQIFLFEIIKLDILRVKGLNGFSDKLLTCSCS